MLIKLKKDLVDEWRSDVGRPLNYRARVSGRLGATERAMFGCQIFVDGVKVEGGAWYVDRRAGFICTYDLGDGYKRFLASRNPEYAKRFPQVDDILYRVISGEVTVLAPEAI